jgi:hypothetical protein
MKLNTVKPKKSGKKEKENSLYYVCLYCFLGDASPADTIHSDTFDPDSLIPSRGGEKTATCLYRPGILSDEALDKYMKQVKQLKNLPLAPHSSDLMDRALVELEEHNYDTSLALQSMSRLKKKDFKHAVDWSTEEINAFEQSIRDHGHDLNYAKKSVQTKEMGDIVRYFYQWKKTDRYETVYSEWTKIYRPT